MTRHNLDVFGTTMRTPILAGIVSITSFIEGILNAQTMEEIARTINRNTLTETRREVLVRDPGLTQAVLDGQMSPYESGPMIFVDGAADNQTANPSATPQTSNPVVAP